jgi:hypothetical protein
MNLRSIGIRVGLGAAIFAGTLLAGATFRAQTSTSNLWIHVRVENPENKEETVRVNLPVSLAEILVSSVDHDQLHHGHINISRHGDLNGVDLRAMVDAVKSAPDGEFVSVKSKDQDVHVSKQKGNLLIRVNDSSRKDKQEVDVSVPMSVVDALISSSKGSDDLDIGAALRALASHGDSELVNVKDGKETVHIWLDSKNDGE